MAGFWASVAGGVLLILLGIYSIMKAAKRKMNCTVSVSAQIVKVELERESMDAGDTYRTFKYYYPVYQYRVDGELMESRGKIPGQRKKAFTVGDEVRVLYDPDKPGDVIPDDGKGAFSKGAITPIIVGMILIALTLVNAL